MESDVEKIYTWWLDAAAIFLRYFILAGGGYLVFYFWKKTFFAGRKIQRQFPERRLIRQEIFYSVITLILYCAASWAIFFLKKSGHTKIYLDIHQYGYAYFMLSILFMILLHDA